jgi:predicted metal-dependent peptidase
MRAETLIARARTQLVLSHPFFGALALHLQPRATDEVPTAGTDGENLFYNPAWVETVAQQEGQDVLQGLVAHEVLHVALAHLWRRQGRKHNKFNVACDLAINSIILDAGLKIPAGGLVDKQFAGMTAEAIYAKLPDQQQDQGEEEGKDGEQDQSGNPSPSQQGQQKNGNPQPSSGQPDQQPWGDHGKWDNANQDPAKAERLQREWKVRVAQAADAARKRGQLPAGLERLVQAALYPKVDWRQALANFLQPTRCDYSFNPPDRRFLNGEYGEIALPDFQEEALEDVVIAIDTSGSIGNKELTQFLAEVRGIITSYPQFRGHLVTCDAEVQEWHELTQDGWPPIKCKGGGGTDFRPVFAEVQKRGIDPSALVYLTDAEGDFPKDPPGYPVLWVVLNNPRATVPFGARVDMEVD